MHEVTEMQIAAREDDTFDVVCLDVREQGIEFARGIAPPAFPCPILNRLDKLRQNYRAGDDELDRGRAVLQLSLQPGELVVSQNVIFLDAMVASIEQEDLDRPAAHAREDAGYAFLRQAILAL